MKEEKIRRREELRRKNKKKHNKGKELVSVILISIIFLIIATLSYIYYLTTPVDRGNNQKISVEVKESYGASKISDILYEKNLIKSPTLFKIYSRIGSEEFYVGQFEITKNMKMSEIINVLTTKEKATSGKTISVIEGENIKQIAKKVAQFTEISEEQFLSKANDQEFINKLKQEFPELITNELDSPNLKYKLEGYLYPAKYNLDQTNINNVELLIKQMISITNSKVVPLYQKNNKVWNIGGINKNITIHDYITMASILEKESTVNADNNAIAGVFMNRLAISMPLQTDPTVYYSANRLQSSGPITIQELQGRDLYNTYVHYGLPPGPIASPSELSYNALNNVAKHDYKYFLHAKDGKAYFAKTYQEHEELAKKYIEGYVASGS